MKKSIVLLISLFFISSISVLILINLKQTNDYLNNQNYKIDNIQMLLIINNLQVEVAKILKEKEDSLEEILEKSQNIYIPFTIEDIEVSFLINKYDKIDINLLDNKDSNAYNSISVLFNNNDISNFELFKYIYTVKKRDFLDLKETSESFVNNSKQVDDIIDSFLKDSYDNKILDIKNSIGFIKKESNEDLYELFINITYLKYFAKAYYVLDKKGDIKYFEFSFK